jgi:hypothetical protein
VHPSARGLWILLASLAFLAGFATASAWLRGAGWTVPGGVLVVAAVVFVAPAAVGLLRLVGFWHDATGLDPLEEYEGPLVLVALATALAGLFAFRRSASRSCWRFRPPPSPRSASSSCPSSRRGRAPPITRTARSSPGPFSSPWGLRSTAGARVAPRSGGTSWLATLTLGLSYQAFRNSSWGWILILVAGAGFLAFATVLRRATWALFGVAGFFAATAHYLDEWLGTLGAAFAIGLVGPGLVALGIAAQLAPRLRFDT